MEKKGIISDRCEPNRQIKADNALLRELRGQVKKLAQAVKNTLPAIAEAMEHLRKNLLLFCYQLGYLRKGKEHLNASLNTLPPALSQYNQLAKDIRDKTKERRSLLSEKKALSAVHVFRHRELAAKIAALMEDLEELRSEKNLLLASLAYTEEDAADKFPSEWSCASSPFLMIVLLFRTHVTQSKLLFLLVFLLYGDLSIYKS